MAKSKDSCDIVAPGVTLKASWFMTSFKLTCNAIAFLSTTPEAAGISLEMVAVTWSNDVNWVVIVVLSD